MERMTSGNAEDNVHTQHFDAVRYFRVEHRVHGLEPVVLARIKNVFPHHDTLTQYVSRLLNEQGSELLTGELVLVDESTEAVLARRDLRRACRDTKRLRKPPKRPDND